MKHNCAEVALDIKTNYAGKNQCTHPNVIAFDEPWHGYRYWMAYTPYPYANGSEENPSVCASNDLINFETPDGLKNPIACSAENNCDELKDTHLFYNDSNNTLELWYLGRLNSSIAEGGPLFCFRKTTSDGIHWTGRETMYQFTEANLASETVMYSKEKGYEFWGIRNDQQDIGLYYMTSADGFSWSDLIRCEVSMDKKTNMWHGAVTYYNSKYYFVWVGKKGDSSQHIYLATGSDGQRFTNTTKVVSNDTKWLGLYRPSLTIVNDTFYCYYGVIRIDNKWMIGLSYGKDINQLVGITQNEVADNSNKRVAIYRELQLYYMKLRTIKYVIPRLVATSILSLVIQFLMKNALVGLPISVVLSTILCYFCFSKEETFKLGLINGIIGFILSTCCYAISMDVIKLIFG